MAGQYRFKDINGNVVAQISASSAGAISFSGSAVDFSNASTITLGEVQLAGTASNALLLDGFDSTAFVFTSSFNTISQSISSQLNTLQTTSGSNIGRLNNLESKSSSVDISISNINSFTASNDNTSLNSKTGSYATTGSNTFFGTQTYSGSVYIANDLIVQGSSSIQYISASSVSIGTNIVQLNTANPSVRFAGLTMIDSGSIGGSGSFLYDSVQDEFIFVHRGNGTNVTSSHFVTGPETYDNLGNELYLTCNIITKGTGKEHLVDSCIFDNGTTTCIKNNLITTGTSCFGGNICANVNSNTFGNASSAGRSLILQAGSGNQAIQFKNCWGGDGTLYACGNATAFHYGFNTYSCSDVLFIANGGNVGLSCNNPGYTLDVNGNAHFRTDGGTMLIESTQPTNASTLKIIQCSTGGNGNTDQGLVVQTNAGDGTSNIANFYDYNNGSAISRVRFLRSGITCFQNTICVAGQVSSEDVRIYRSAGTTTGYINFGSTGTNYFGWDGGKFSANGCIAGTASIFSNTVITSCKILVNGTAAAWGGIPGYEINTSLEAILGFKKNGSAAGYVYHNGTNMYLANELSGISGCIVFNNNAAQVGRFDANGNFCAAGQLRGSDLCVTSYSFVGSMICGSNIRIGNHGFNTGYTSDGILGGTATPSYIVGSGYNSGFYLGYVDNGSGLYGAAYLFSVKCTHGGGGTGTAEYDAIRMRNAESGVTPFRITNWGNLYATSKNFRINHPLPSMNNTHHLVHTAIEGPQADLIYRGKVQLVNGKAEVNIDESARMTDGTFELLCQNVQSYTTNENGWTLIKSYVIGNILHIEAQDQTSDDMISWLVIGERKDDGLKNSNITDNDGHLLVETLIPELEL